MKKKFPVILATFVSVILPLVTFAQIQTSGTCSGVATGAVGGIAGVICTIYGIIRILIPVLVIGAIAYFIYGVIMFVIAGDAEEKGAGRTMMVNGIIGFAVIIGLWGLVNILLTTFGVNSATSTPVLPGF